MRLIWVKLNWRTIKILVILVILIFIAFCPHGILAVQKIKCVDLDEFVIQESESKKKLSETFSIQEVNHDLIIVDTYKFQLTLYQDQKKIKTFPVAIGKKETPSPIGEWKIVHKGGNWGGGFGLRWMGLNVPWGIYGIHGTNKPGSIGRAESHGCIRMHNKHVMELYSLVKVGTMVHIIGNPPKVKIRKEFKKGQTGKDVIFLQFRLRAKGFSPGVVDGRFGEGVEKAVLNFQYFYGLPLTGKVGVLEANLLELR